MGLSDNIASARTDPRASERLIRRMAEELAKRIDPEDIDRLSRIGAHEGFIKNANDEIEKTELWNFSLSPTWDNPAWPVVQAAAPTKITASRTKPDTSEGCEVVLILPDPQIGYRRMADGEMIPFHCEASMDVAIQLVRHIRPAEIINLGDTLDMTEWSAKFIQLPEFVQTTQPALDRTHRFLADQRANAPAGIPIGKLRGNHDDRFEMAIVTNAKSAMRLRQANKPESWPVLSLSNLLRVDELEIEISGGYPAGRFLIAEGARGKTPLYAIHGKKVDVVKQAKASMLSTIQGHIHRIAEHHETHDDGHGNAAHVVAISGGCLCRTDGVVPGVESAEDEHGRPVPLVNNWQNAVTVVYRWPDGYWTHEVIEINDGTAAWRGKTFTAAQP